MAIYRNVYTNFWNDVFILKRTPHEKLFYLYLMTNPKTSICGIYEFSVAVASLETGLNPKQIEDLIAKFQNEYHRIVYSPDTDEIAILNWLKHNNSNSPTVQNAIQTGFAKVKNQALVELMTKDINTVAIQYQYPIYTPSRARVTDTVPVTDTVSDVLKENGKTKDKKKYGEFGNVKLTTEEYEKLKTKYGNVLELVDFLDRYIEEKGDKYKSHYSAIQRWVADAVEERKKKGNNGSTYGKPTPPDVRIEWLDSYLKESEKASEEEKRKRDEEYERTLSKPIEEKIKDNEEFLKTLTPGTKPYLQVQTHIENLRKEANIQ